MSDRAIDTSTHGVIGRYDLHVHTTMSDGDLTLEEVVRVATGRGVRVGIADHVSSRNTDLFVATPEALESYLQALDEQPVFRSAELCWCDAFSQSLTPEQLARFDYLIGSNHGFRLPDGSLGSPWWRSLPPAWENEPERLMAILVDNVCELVETMPIAIIAHPTLIPPALLTMDPDPRTWWTEEHEDRLIDAAVRSEVALEISNRYRLPHDRLLEKALEAGARFSLGSDGHQLGQVARLDWAVATARRVGIGDADLFIPLRD